MKIKKSNISLARLLQKLCFSMVFLQKTLIILFSFLIITTSCESESEKEKKEEIKGYIAFYVEVYDDEDNFALGDILLYFVNDKNKKISPFFTSYSTKRSNREHIHIYDPNFKKGEKNIKLIAADPEGVYKKHEETLKISHDMKQYPKKIILRLKKDNQ